MTQFAERYKSDVEVALDDVYVGSRRHILGRFRMLSRVLPLPLSVAAWLLQGENVGR